MLPAGIQFRNSTWLELVITILLAPNRTGYCLWCIFVSSVHLVRTCGTFVTHNTTTNGSRSAGHACADLLNGPMNNHRQRTATTTYVRGASRTNDLYLIFFSLILNSKVVRFIVSCFSLFGTDTLGYIFYWWLSRLGLFFSAIRQRKLVYTYS